MADNVLKSRIKHAYKTESEWTTLNPVLLKGEVAYSSDKGNMYKTGDGTSTWSALSYNTANTANSATKLATSRTFRTNLASTSTASFDGSANVTPGVTGVLPVANGGTGNSSVDTTPTDGSTKMVTSGGVYTALSEKQDLIPAWADSMGTNSITLNHKNAAFGNYSCAEGGYTYAIGQYSHAEGYYTTAFGISSHSEGGSTGAALTQIGSLGTDTTNSDIITTWVSKKFSLAKGNSSHVEGKDCLALGEYSHAEGYCTIASGRNQHVQGKYNIEDTSSTYAHIVGNGTADDARSNAYTLDWHGNGWYAGGLTVNSDLVMVNNGSAIKFHPTSNTKYDEFQFRLSGSTGTQGMSIVGYKDGSIVEYGNIFSHEHFMPDFPVSIYSINTYGFSSGSAVANGSTNTKTTTIPAIPSGCSYALLVGRSGYCCMSNYSVSGTTLSVTMMNISGASHTLTLYVTLIVFKNRW